MQKYWKEKESSTMITAPAEKCIEDLVNRCDFVHCWNVLDHCFDPSLIINNIIRYAKSSAIVLIGTDFSRPHIGHPGLKQEEFWPLINTEFEILKQQRAIGHRQLAIKLRKK